MNERRGEVDREALWVERLKAAPRAKEADLLIGRYYDEIYIFAYKQTFDKELALDLTQEIFISVLKSVSLFDAGKASFRTWLYKIATNKVIDYRRSRHNNAPPFIDIEAMDIPNEADFTKAFEDRELAQRVEAYISTLHGDYQEVFRLRVYGGYGFPEIAGITGKAEATVKTGYYRLVKQIRKEFSDEYTDAKP